MQTYQITRKSQIAQTAQALLLYVSWDEFLALMALYVARQQIEADKHVEKRINPMIFRNLPRGKRHWEKMAVRTVRYPTVIVMLEMASV